MSSLKKIKSETASLFEDDRARLRGRLTEKDPRGRDEETGREPTSGGRDSRAKEAGGGKKRKRRPQKRDEQETGSYSSRGARPSEGSEEVLREYEGKVRAIYEDEGIFVASLIDLTAGETWPSDAAEFSIGDVSDDDRKLLRKGAVFYWTTWRRVLKGREESFERLQFDPSLLTMSDFLLMERREQRLAEILGPED